jgi:hypothetical protein
MLAIACGALNTCRLQEQDIALVIRAGTALGESVQHPTVHTIQAIGDTIARLRAQTVLAAVAP